MGSRILFLILLMSFSSLADECSEFEKFRCESGESFKIHLTFDDGPHKIHTPKVLSTLKKYKQRVTFFVVGESYTSGSLEDIAQKKIIMDDMKRDGHLIGSHSFKHVLHTKLNDKNLKHYVQKSKVVFQNYLSFPYLFRLPYGDGWHPLTVNKPRAQYVMRELDSQKFNHIGWSLDADDWDKRKQRRPGILAILLHEICENKGGVVLLHDNQKNTADNLDRWLKALQCLGHINTPLEEFMNESYIQRTTHSRTPTSKKGKL